jgi:hypothetical protein
MKALSNLGSCVLACGLAWGLLTGAAGATDAGQAPAAPLPAPRDGQHDFDFETGTWKTHISRLVHPLTGSTTWVEYEGTSVVRKLWDGRANLLELEVGGSSGHIEALSLRLYNPDSHQWSFNFANSAAGTLGQPTIGDQKRSWRVLRSGNTRRPRRAGAICHIGHHARILSLRTGLFRRRRQDLGSQLGRDRHANETIPL